MQTSHSRIQLRQHLILDPNHPTLQYLVVNCFVFGVTLGQLLLRKLRHTRGTADLVPSAWGNACHGQGHPKQVLSDVYFCWKWLEICWMTYKLNIAFPCQTILVSFPVGQTYDIDVTQAGDNCTLEDCTIQIGVTVSMLQV